MLHRDAKNPRTVCIVRPTSGAYTETFIEAHIRHLPARTITLSSVWHDPRRARVLPMPRAVSYIYRGARAWVEQFRIKSTLATTGFRLAEVLSIMRFLRRQRVDVVLAEYGHTGVMMMDACRQARIPLVVHFHGYDAYAAWHLERQHAGYQRLFEQASALIAVSHDMEQQLGALGARRETIHYNPYGVDLAQFAPTNPADNPPTFVAVGRFVDKKAPHLTLLAFHKLLRTVPEARLIMIGDGPLWDACQQMATALDIDHAVTFAGACSHEDVAAAMRQARAFVQHSLRPGSGDSEGTPVSVLEAGACGLPLVSTRHAGIKDVVIEEETGLLVDEHDIAGMAAQMIRLAQEPALAAALGQRARERIASHFSLDHSIANLWYILEQTLVS
jgi:glycosyltransferase involved in cell wall biosynthesis